MTHDRRNRTIRRPSLVVVALGAAALVTVPPSAGVQSTSPAAPAAAAPVVAPGLAAEAAELSEQAPAALSVRLNPVAFRESVAAARPAVVRPSPVTRPEVVAAPQAPARVLPKITTTARPGTAAAVAIDFALAQRGLPYVWGGNGPQQGHRGFDCSGLTTYAYKKAGVDLPRTAHTQYYEGPHVPGDADLEPGDLVFYGVPERVHHVGLYIGNGQMVAAPTFGKPVRTSYVRYNGDDYLGATRPAAGRDADEGLLSTPELPVVVPPLPSPEVPPAPEEFQAPPVPPEEIVQPEAPAAVPLVADAPPAEDAPVEPTVDEQPAARAEGAAEDDPGAESDGAETTTATPPADEGSTAEETGTPEAMTTEGAPSETEGAPETAPSEIPPSDAPPAEEIPPSDAPPAEEIPPSDAPPAEEIPPFEVPVAEDAPVAEVGPPVALTLAGIELAVARAESDDNGLPSAPESADRGALRWSPAEDGRAARAIVALHADGVVPEVGSVVTIRAEDGSAVELTVRSRDVVDRDTAADLASGRGESTRLVLLVADPGSDGFVVLIAE